MRGVAFHLQCVPHTFFLGKEITAIGEAVRRDVEHAHDQRARAEIQGVRRELQAEFSSWSHFDERVVSAGTLSSTPRPTLTNWGWGTLRLFISWRIFSTLTD